jgi:hypothetical protein
MLRRSRQLRLKWSRKKGKHKTFRRVQLLCYWEVNFVMVRVRVQRIESIRDPEGNLGKRIELLEDRVVPRMVIRPQTDEARMAQDIMQALQQQMPMFPQQTQFTFPKLVLFLTEQEYEDLGVDFDVNQVYELDLSNKSISFKKAP